MEYPIRAAQPGLGCDASLIRYAGLIRHTYATSRIVGDRPMHDQFWLQKLAGIGILDMRSAGLIAGVLLLLCGDEAIAREAGNFGFGRPPSYRETRELILGHLKLTLKDPDSLRDLTIAKPAADCYRRGIGRRDVCGYKICVAYNAKNSFGAYIGRKVYVYWKLNGWGTQVFENAGACPILFPDWDGKSPVQMRDFCVFQKKHPDCEKGRKEKYDFPVDVPAPASTDEGSAGGFSRCSEPIRLGMLDRGLSEEDVSELCGCSDALVQSMKAKGLSGEDISAICKPES